MAIWLSEKLSNANQCVGWLAMTAEKGCVLIIKKCQLGWLFQYPDPVTILFWLTSVTLLLCDYLFHVFVPEREKFQWLRCNIQLCLGWPVWWPVQSLALLERRSDTSLTSASLSGLFIDYSQAVWTRLFVTVVACCCCVRRGGRTLFLRLPTGTGPSLCLCWVIDIIVFCCLIWEADWWLWYLLWWLIRLFFPLFRYLPHFWYLHSIPFSLEEVTVDYSVLLHCW